MGEQEAGREEWAVSIKPSEFAADWKWGHPDRTKQLALKSDSTVSTQAARAPHLGLHFSVGQKGETEVLKFCGSPEKPWGFTVILTSRLGWDRTGEGRLRGQACWMTQALLGDWAGPTTRWPLLPGGRNVFVNLARGSRSLGTVCEA